MDCSLPGSSVHGILQARILEWVIIPFSRGSSWPRNPTQVSCIEGRFFTICATMKGNTVPSQPNYTIYSTKFYENLQHDRNSSSNKGCKDRYLLPLSSGNSLLIWRNKLISSVAQSCPTLRDPMGCSMPGLSVHHQLLEFMEGTIISVIRAKVKIHTKYDEKGVTGKSGSFQRKWDILT